jgi:GT2 family glycosyltransferase
MKYKIAAVVVTFNRLELLKQCIENLRNQTHKLDEIIIVNNSSTDGTLEWLVEQTDLTVITQENSGSAGGQHTGIKRAYEKGYDWIWCLDTDVIPEKDSLEMFLNSSKINEPQTGFLTSAIYFTDGNLCFINLPYTKDRVSIFQLIQNENSISILSASFGSVLFSRKAITEVGLPIKDFFIWGDDVEYTFRMIEANYFGFLISSSKATHFAPNNLENPFSQMDYSDKKSFYCVRNTVYTIKLRNKLLLRSYVRTMLSAMRFYYSTLKNYSKITGWDIKSYVTFSKYFLVGLFYNPRKYLLKND